MAASLKDDLECVAVRKSRCGVSLKMFIESRGRGLEFQRPIPFYALLRP